MYFPESRLYSSVKLAAGAMHHGPRGVGQRALEELPAPGPALRAASVPHDLAARERDLRPRVELDPFVGCVVDVVMQHAVADRDLAALDPDHEVCVRADRDRALA